VEDWSFFFQNDANYAGVNGVLALLQRDQQQAAAVLRVPVVGPDAVVLQPGAGHAAIAGYVAAANEAFERGAYDVAREWGEQIVRLHPDEAAQRLVLLADEAARLASPQVEAEWKAAFERLSREGVATGAALDPSAGAHFQDGDHDGDTEGRGRAGQAFEPGLLDRSRGLGLAGGGEAAPADDLFFGSSASPGADAGDRHDYDVVAKAPDLAEGRFLAPPVTRTGLMGVDVPLPQKGRAFHFRSLHAATPITLEVSRRGMGEAGRWLLFGLVVLGVAMAAAAVRRMRGRAAGSP
jgi:hypothetical protein